MAKRPEPLEHYDHCPGARFRPVEVKCCPHPSPRAFNRAANKALVLEDPAVGSQPLIGPLRPPGLTR